MSDLFRHRQRSYLALAILLAVASPAWATDEESASLFDWNRPWSAMRVGLWLVTLLPAAAISYLAFRNWLAPSRANPPWPRTAFGRAAALLWVLGGASFVLLFGISGELRQGGWQLLPPGGGFANFVNVNLLLIVTISIIVSGVWFIQWAFRHNSNAT